MSHTIEQNLERIANALEAIAANGGGLSVTNVVTTAAGDDGAAEKAAAAAKAAADKKAKDEAAAKAKAEAAAKEKAEKEAAEKAAAEAAVSKPADGPSIDDVRLALKAYREIEGAAAMLDVLKSFGAENLQALKPEHFADVIAKVS